MSQIVYNGITYEVEPAILDTARTLLEHIIAGRKAGALLSLTGDDGAGGQTWHRLYITAGAPITLVD